MLFSIIFELTTNRSGHLPANLGRANHGQLMAWLAQVDQPLVDALHEASQLRPITCSSLLGAKQTGDSIRIDAGQTYAVRFTSLHADLSTRLDHWLRVQPPDQWPLHNHPFAVSAIYCDPDRHSWSGMTTYEDLAGRYLLADAHPPKKVTFEFASPTAFKSKGMHLPVPMPGLVFGSLFDRWNAFSPVQLPDDMRDYGEMAVAVSHYRLHTESAPNKGGSTLIGAVGSVTYTALGGDRYWLAAMNLLADYALYSGVGVKTTVGLGQARRRKNQG